MSDTSLQFGTSGLRGLAAELDGPPAFAYGLAFAGLMKARGMRTGRVLIGRDLRASSAAIAGRCAAAVAQAGLEPVDCGQLPTPALALCAIEDAVPAIMVTGSHIPEDRNGLKFYRPDGEIDKADEQAIAELVAGGVASEIAPLAATVSGDRDALARYRRRYLDFFAPNCLSGRRIGVYQHSSVARDFLDGLLDALGAETVPLGRADRFVAIDTEALRGEDIVSARNWARDERLDAIVSTDGDADRPLIADETGRFLPGDLVGAITARHLGADCIITPVTSNSALEARFATVRRTRVGSPHVIAAMRDVAGADRIVGFEANGGVLLGSAIEEGGRHLAALPTRDAVLPILCMLAAAASAGRSVGEIAHGLGFRATATQRLQEVPASASRPFLERLAGDTAFRDRLLAAVGPVERVDGLDGVRIICAGGEIVHFRASGNAPELRCYVEAADAKRAGWLLDWALETAGARIREEALS